MRNADVLVIANRTAASKELIHALQGRAESSLPIPLARA